MKTPNLKTMTAFLTALALSASPALADGHLPGEGVTVRPVEGTNPEEKFQHRIVYRALEKLGYEVDEPQEVGYQTGHLALGTGDGDFTAVHWDPLHLAFLRGVGRRRQDSPGRRFDHRGAAGVSGRQGQLRRGRDKSGGFEGRGNGEAL